MYIAIASNMPCSFSEDIPAYFLPDPRSLQYKFKTLFKEETIITQYIIKYFLYSPSSSV